MMVELHFAALNSSFVGQATGLNIANHRGAAPITPGILIMLIPTSISSWGVRTGSRMSQYMRPLPALPPNNPLSVRIGTSLKMVGVRAGVLISVLLQSTEGCNTMSSTLLRVACREPES